MRRTLCKIPVAAVWLACTELVECVETEVVAAAHVSDFAVTGASAV